MIELLTLTALALASFPQTPPAAEAPADPPARVAWQRSLEDALAAQKATGLPLLIAVNMDGEVFNERFAKSAYRQKDFIASTRNYICVVASPDRHSERDYDALGNRIECPRFGGCTCSEHINIEPELFRRYFNNKRNAPRHVGVKKGGKIMFDRFLDASMQTAIQAIANNGGTGKPKHLAATDSTDEMFRRRDAMARSLLERRYQKGDKAARQKLLERAATAKNNPVDLLRMGLRDPDSQLCGLAALALSKVGGPEALIDIEDALARIDDADIKQQLVAQLRKLGKDNAAAARMASHFEASKDQLAQPWRNEWSKTELGQGRTGIEAELDQVEAAIRSKPNDPELRLRLATAQAAFALMLMEEGGSGIELWLADAKRNASKVKAEALQPEAKALHAITGWYQSDVATAQRSAVAAMASGNSKRTPDAWLATNLLDVMLQLTAQTAYGRANQDAAVSLRGELSRVRTTVELLQERGTMRERGTLAGIGLLEFAGLRAEARAYLERLVERFPGSITVHDRWRNRMLVDFGAERMRHRYAKFVTDATDRATAQWYAGYAALVAADRHTLDGRMIEAENAYTDAVERFVESAGRNEAYADTANHYAVLALAGRAHIRQQRGTLNSAVKDLLRAANLRPGSLDEDDGLKRKPRGIISRVHAALKRAGKTELAEQIAALLP